MAREIKAEAIVEKIFQLILKASFELRRDVLNAILLAAERETGLARKNLEIIADNAYFAYERKKPLCQDTGVVEVFLEIGQGVILPSEPLKDLVEKAVKMAFKEGALRASVVNDPLFERKNTGDSCPAVVDCELVPGERLRVLVMLKGAGSENTSFLRMLSPAVGIRGLKEVILKRLYERIPYACPPVIIGVAVGGTFDTVARAAKKTLFEPVGRRNSSLGLGRLEEEILNEVNSWGIGPQALGGKTTALAVHFRALPSHIASLPMAVCLSCHSLRTAEAEF